MAWRSQTKRLRWEEGRGSRSRMPELGDHETAGSHLIKSLSLDRQNPHVLRIPEHVKYIGGDMRVEKK